MPWPGCVGVRRTGLQLACNRLTSFIRSIMRSFGRWTPIPTIEMLPFQYHDTPANRTHSMCEIAQCAYKFAPSHRTITTDRSQPTDHNRLQRLQILPQMRHRKLQPPMPSWSNELILDENRPVLAHPAAASARTIRNITHLRGIWRILGHSREKQPLCTSNAVQRWSAYGIVEGEQRIGNTGRHVVRGNDIRASTLCGLPHVVANKLHHIWISFRLASGFQRVFLADGLTGIHNRLQKYILDIRQRHII